MTSMAALQPSVCAMRQTIEQAAAAKPRLRHRFSTGRLRKRASRDRLAPSYQRLYQGWVFEPAFAAKSPDHRCFFDCSRLILILALVVAAPPSFDAMAQAIGQGAAGLIADQQKAIQDLTAKTDGLEKEIQEDGEDDATLVEIRLQLEEMSRAALTSALAFRSRLTDINNRIETLGPPPAAGQPQEPDIVTGERQALAVGKGRDQCRHWLAAQNLSIRINGLIDKIGNMRSELFRNLLTKRYELSDALSPQVVSDAQDEYVNLYKAVSSWLSFVFKFKFKAMLAATFIALAARSGAAGRRPPPVRALSSKPIRRSRIHPISAGCRWRSGRHCCRHWPSAPSSLRRSSCSIITTSCAAILAFSSTRWSAVIAVVFCVNRLTNAAL